MRVVKAPFYKARNGKLFTENELYFGLNDIEAASYMGPLTETSENP